MFNACHLPVYKQIRELHREDSSVLLSPMFEPSGAPHRSEGKCPLVVEN